MNQHNQLLNRHNSQVIQSYNSILKDVQNEPQFVFMNHGYAPTNVELAGDDENWKHQISLYNSLVLSAVGCGMPPLTANTSILEVGCGRGGGLSFIKRHFKPEIAVGIDLNPNQIAFCDKTHSKHGIDFKVADACNLPFAEESFDIVINVESAHLYSNINLFYAQVKNVLKGDGYFLYTDIYRKSSELYQRLLARDSQVIEGLDILHSQDITENVIDACHYDKTFFKSTFPSEEMAFLSDFSAEKEALYKQGDIKYLTVIAKKLQK